MQQSKQRKMSGGYARDIYSEVLFSFKNCYLRQSKGGFWHCVLHEADDETISLASIAVMKNRDQPFKLFYPWPSFHHPQKTEYFTTIGELVEWVNNNYATLQKEGEK
jgi:hypothetical protein